MPHRALVLVASLVAASAAGPLLVVVDPDMPSWHWSLSREGPVRNCPVACEFSMDMKRVPSAAGVVFLGDKELYSRKAQDLPPKPSPDTVYFVILREYLPLFPEKLWERYDARITYSRDPSTAVVYSYAAPDTLAGVSSTPSFEERSTDGLALAAFVSLRCGNPGDKNDGRTRRTNLALALQALGDDLVDSYGVCARNKQWPEGHLKDKAYVMRNHKFCIAMENNVHDDYVTEKLWDCLSSGAIPIYFGAPNVVDHLPGGRASVLMVADYATPADLAADMRRIGADKALFDSYRSWMNQPRPPAWTALMNAIDPNTSQCRVCQYLADKAAAKKAAVAKDDL